jgi:hypothetical protein
LKVFYNSALNPSGPGVFFFFFFFFFFFNVSIIWPVDISVGHFLN